MRKDKLLRGCFISVFLVLMSCSRQETKNVPEPIKVQTMQVITKDIPVEINSFGVLSANKDVDIKAQVSGQVKNIYFKEGSYVKRDELLISIDNESYKTNLRMNEAALSQDIEDYKYKKHVLEKEHKLYQTGSIPKRTYEKMLTEFAQLKARLKSDQAKIDLDKINLKHCSITSPVNGVIGYIKVDEGNIITSSSDVLANVKEIDPLCVDFSVPGKDLFRIKNALKEKGEVKVIISVNSKKNDNSNFDLQYEGILKSLNNEVQDMSGTIQLRGIIPNPKMDLLPGLFVNVKLIVGELKNVILIPAEGLIFDNDKHYFFTVSSDGVARKASVDVIGSYENYCVAVKSDEIKPGNRVIVTGLLNLVPNEKVIIEEYPTPNV